ncbi:MAG: GNAT family protein [Chloroflexota bacterium]
MSHSNSDFVTNLPEVIKTERLVLRPVEFGDVEDIYTYASDPEFSRYLPIPQPYTERSAKEFVARQILADRAVMQAWGIELFGRIVGGINLRFSDGFMVAEVGYGLARRCWGNGYMTEAASVVIDTAFHHIESLQKVRAMADKRNVGSWRVMEKIGMQQEGVLRQNRLINSEMIDEVWTGILRHEWEARSAT